MAVIMSFVFPNIQFRGRSQKMELVQQKEENREAKVFRVASELFRQDPDWVTFFREVLGVDGIVRQVFTSPHEIAKFEQTNEYLEIQQMVAKLRERVSEPIDSREPTRVITVRLPKSLHESLRTEAHERKTSMNKLCISKLLQIVDEELIPSD
jgi:predicted HicB family RNase H-like nuclease